MAESGRFAKISPVEIKKLLDNSTSKSTVKSTKFGMRLFDEWRASPSGEKFAKPIEEMSKEELNACLKYFYTSARKQDGSYYKATSLKSIRSAIDRHLRSPPHCKQFSIISDASFTEANRVLFAFVKDLKLSGKIEGVAHRQAVTKEQLQKLYTSGQLGPANSEDPAQLQRTVWFYIGLYFGRRGLENQRDLKSEMLVLRKSPHGVEYFELNRQMPTSVRTITDSKDEHDAKFMFSVVGSSRCPVTTVKNYLSHLNPASDLLFQRPRDKRSLKFRTKDIIWYWPGSLGTSTLERFLTNMSKKAGIQPHLTKHCLKATSTEMFSNASGIKWHRFKAKGEDEPGQSSQSHHRAPSLEEQKHKSDVLGKFLASETQGGIRIPPISQPKVVATMIEIEQQPQRRQEDSRQGAIVLEVRQIPIVVQQQPQGLVAAVSSNSSYVNVAQYSEHANHASPPTCVLYNVIIQNPAEKKLLPLAPRSVENMPFQK